MYSQVGRMDSLCPGEDLQDHGLWDANPQLPGIAGAQWSLDWSWAWGVQIFRLQNLHDVMGWISLHIFAWFWWFLGILFSCDSFLVQFRSHIKPEIPKFLPVFSVAHAGFISPFSVVKNGQNISNPTSMSIALCWVDPGKTSPVAPEPEMVYHAELSLDSMTLDFSRSGWGGWASDSGDNMDIKPSTVGTWYGLMGLNIG